MTEIAGFDYECPGCGAQWYGFAEDGLCPVCEAQCVSTEELELANSADDLLGEEE